MHVFLFVCFASSEHELGRASSIYCKVIHVRNNDAVLEAVYGTFVFSKLKVNQQ